MSVLINIDVPDLARAVEFYKAAFGLTDSRRLGAQVAELQGWPSPLYLLEKPSGTAGAGGMERRYSRHWTPIHLDIVVDDIEAAMSRAAAAGAVIEQPARTHVWGRIAVLADPFGHGLCLIEFRGRGYDEIAEPGAPQNRSVPATGGRRRVSG